MKIAFPLPLVAFTLVASVLIADAVARDDVKHPNVLLILADDLGFSDIGCYGGEIATPHLDGLAKQGLRYTQFYNTARCWPTRAALLTGYYAQQVNRDALPGARRGGKGVRPPWAPLLPQRLTGLGYRSYHCGKWHIDGTPREGGFHRSYWTNDHNRFFHPRTHLLDDQELPPVPPGTDYYATTAIADRTIEFLWQHASDHSDQPFFQYTAFIAPHFPLHAPTDDIARYSGRYADGWDAVRRERFARVRDQLQLRTQLSALEPDIGPPYHFQQAIEALGSGEVNRELPWDQLTAQQQSFQAAKMEIHAAMVERMDREIGRILEQLRTMGALKNTVIFFLSDNGASAEIMIRGDGHRPTSPPGSADTYLCLGPGWSSAANTPFRRHKTWVHEGGIATPLVVHWPEGINAHGALRSAIGHAIDIAPTIVELAGGKWQRWASDQVLERPSCNLRPTFDADVALERDTLWWLHEGNRALRKGKWKLVAAKDEPWELYDLTRDRAETNNLANVHPERVAKLAAQWSDITAQMENSTLDRDGLPRKSAQPVERFSGSDAGP